MKIKFFAILPIILIIIIIIAGINYISNLKTLNRPTFFLPTTIPYKTTNCPSGFIKVPGNSFYKTVEFCVMKYDAKCTNPDPKCITSEGVYKNNLTGCECQGDYHVVSKPDGAPITFIPETSNDGVNAKDYCQKEGWHLMTNSEWMTIAMNVSNTNLNWCDRNGTNCGNKPGSPGKILANGHNDSFPAKALESGDDSEPCYLTSNGNSNNCGLPGSQKRTLDLSNGQVIWDFAGNVWQWIDIVIARKDEPRSKTADLGGTGWVWAEFQTVPENSDFYPPDPSWSSTQGVGRIYHYNLPNDTDFTEYTYIRGGNWRHGQDSGAFTVHMQPVPTKTNIDDVGFRCTAYPN